MSLRLKYEQKLVVFLNELVQRHWPLGKSLGRTCIFTSYSKASHYFSLRRKDSMVPV
jgi:hypothetical protein